MADPTIVDINTIPNTINPSPSNHGIILTTTQSQEFRWTFLDDAGINLEDSYNIDHSDHTNGIIKLKATTITSTSSSTSISEDTQYKPEDLSGHTSEFIEFPHKAVYGAKAHNIGMMFYNKKAGYLKRASLGNFKGNFSAGYARLLLYKFDYDNVQGQHLQLLERGISEDGHGNSATRYVGEGNTINHVHNLQTSGYSRIHTRFSGTTFLEKGWYFIFALMDPDPNNTISYIWKPRRKTSTAAWEAIPHGSHPLENRTYNTLVESPCPYHGVDTIHLSSVDYGYGNNESKPYTTYPKWNMYTILETTNSGPADIVLDVTTTTTSTTTNTLMPPGCVVAQTTTTDFDITKITIEANVETPLGSSYDLYVSNDNGAHFFKVSGTSHSFSTIGNQFIWKVCMKASEDNDSPKLKYVQTKGWAVKVTLFGVDTDEIENPPEDPEELPDMAFDGCVVTHAYNGNIMLQEALNNTVPDQFSHWEWVRVWATGPRDDYEEAQSCQSIRINIENSEDGTDFKKIIADLQLAQFMHDSIDYDHYVGSYEADEYNFRCHMDVNLIDYTHVIDDMSTEWTSAQTIDEGTNPVDITIVNEDDETVVSGENLRDVNHIVMTGASEGAIAYKEINKDLSDYHYISLRMKADEEGNDLTQSQLKLVLAADAAGEEVYETFNVPTLRDEWGYVHVIFKLRHPILLSNVEYLVLKAKDTLSNSVNIWGVDAIATEFYPLYGPYLRLRVCITGKGGCTSSVRKVGFVPITK